MVTDAGTGRIVAALDVRLTTMPPTGAAAFSEILQTADPPGITGDGEQAEEEDIEYVPVAPTDNGAVRVMDPTVALITAFCLGVEAVVSTLNFTDLAYIETRTDEGKLRPPKVVGLLMATETPALGAEALRVTVHVAADPAGTGVVQVKDERD